VNPNPPRPARPSNDRRLPFKLFEIALDAVAQLRIELLAQTRAAIGAYPGFAARSHSVDRVEL